MQDNKSQPLILAHSVKGQMSFCHGALFVVCPSTIYQNRYWDFNQHYIVNSHNPGVITEGQSPQFRNMTLYLNSNPPNSGASVSLSYILDMNRKFIHTKAGALG